MEMGIVDGTIFNLSTFEFSEKFDPQGFTAIKKFYQDIGVHYDYQLDPFELTKSISDSGNYVYKKISDISRKQLRGRLADTLIYLSEEVYASIDFELTLTRKEIAELSSMSMENAVRILSEFKKDSIISVNGRKIKILEPDILKKLSDIG